MKTYCAFLIYFLVAFGHISAQHVEKNQDLYITEISYLDSVTVKLDWLLQNPTQYDSLIIFSSKQFPSGYQRLAILSNTSQNSYSFSNVTYQYDTALYFFIQAKNNTSTIESDTVRPIVLKLNISEIINYAGFKKHLIKITWRAPFVSSKLFGSYDLYQKINSANPTVIYAGYDTNYQYYHINCEDDEISHYAVFHPTIMNNTCQSKKDKHIFNKLNNTTRPRFDSVSYIDDNTVQVVWLKGHELTQQYTIYLNQKTGTIDNIPLDTLNINDTTFIYQPPVTDTGSLIYLLTLTDNCGNTTGTYIDDAKRSTVFLHQPTYDICNKKIFLSWEKPLMPDMDSFYIYVSTWGGAWQKLTSVSSHTLQYTYNMLPYDAQYKFMVRAKSTSRKKTSSSNRRSLNITYPAHAENAFFYIPSYQDDKLYFKWAVQPVAQTSFVLEESCNNSIFSKIADFSLSDQSIKFYDIYKDIYNLDTCKYLLHLYDSCGSFLLSKAVAPIHLEIEEWATYVNHLKWKIPELPKMQIKKVILSRMSKTGDPCIDRQFEVSTTFAANFTDSVQPQYRHKGDFEYQLQVTYTDSILWNTDSVMSNKVFAKINKEIFVPNAFTPDAATNQIFRPVLVFVPEDGYYFVIFNRGGQKVFETNNPDEGWDGVDKFAGGPAPQGTYVYVIQYRNKTGKLVDKTGAVTLLR